MASAVILALGILAALVGPAVKLSGQHLAPQIEIVVYGLSVLGAAAVLAWATEVAQHDISRALAYTVLALIAVLPEYAVDMYFAWTAASQPEYASYAAANMTGANRLLIGLGWPLVVLLAWLTARRMVPAEPEDVAEAQRGLPVRLPVEARLDIVVLGVATLYCFLLPLKGSVSLLDGALLIALFGFYAWRVAQAERAEPETIGPAALIARLSTGPRRVTTIAMFLVAAVSIFLCAEPFAEALIATGAVLGIDRFLLVQWLAPLASEAPELIVVALLAVRGQANLGLAALLASKVNQWTLLVGMLPLAYSMASGFPRALPLDAHQSEEVFLTAAQSLFACLILIRLRLTTRGALALFGLFMLQFLIPPLRWPTAIAYLVLAVVLLVRDRDALRAYLPGAKPEPGPPAAVRPPE
ncbi:MAG: sodium:calcium antiporter [Chloroflexi bacterium]|nr:sodium:calcium antiporter [Chloroflexota bacterium]